MHQLGLDFTRRQPSADQVAQDVAALVEFLAGKGWLTADALCIALGWSDRRVRKAASASDEVISYPGSPGYKLLRDCTREEYDRFRNVTLHQADEMKARVVRADRRFFARTAVQA
jgi:23S rRNA A2030 N6-methylase RlmJ